MNSNIEDHITQLPGAAPVENRPDGLWMSAPQVDVQALAELMKSQGARLTTISAIMMDHGETELIYHFASGGQAVNVKTTTRANAIPSIANIYTAASWIERENHDLFGVEFTGHPNLKRLIRPLQMKDGFFRQLGGAAGKAERGETNVL